MHVFFFQNPQRNDENVPHEPPASPFCPASRPRRRPLPADQLALLKAHVAAGKPVLGIRTASHAFHLRNKPAPEGLAASANWIQFTESRGISIGAAACNVTFASVISVTQEGTRT